MKEPRLLNLSDPAIKQMARRYIDALEGVCVFDVRPFRGKRSLDANAYYWGVVLVHVAFGIEEAWGEKMTPEEAHLFCKKEFLSKPIVDRRTGEIKGYKIGSTAELDTTEFAYYLDQIIRFAAEMLGVTIPPASRYRALPRPRRRGQKVTVTTLTPEPTSPAPADPTRKALPWPAS